MTFFASTVHPKTDHDGLERCRGVAVCFVYGMIDIYLTAVGVTPGGSSTAHIYTQTVHRIQRTEHNNQKIKHT
jgi:hypothetical protein